MQVSEEAQERLNTLVQNYNRTHGQDITNFTVETTGTATQATTATSVTTAEAAATTAQANTAQSRAAQDVAAASNGNANSLPSARVSRGSASAVTSSQITGADYLNTHPDVKAAFDTSKIGRSHV